MIHLISMRMDEKLKGSGNKGLPFKAVRCFQVALLLVMAAIMYGCEDVINVNLNEQDLGLFGVEATITTRDDPAVFLYKTLKVSQSGAYPGVSGAVVSVSDNAIPANKVTLVEDLTQRGNYRLPQGTHYPGVAGRAYTLTIQVQGVTLTANDVLSRVEPIDSIQVLPSLRGNKMFLGVFTYGQEPPGLGNYYKWDVYVNNKLLYESSRIAVASDELVDGKYISKFEVFTDFHNPDNAAKERKLNLNDTIFVEQTSISEFAFYYYFQMVNQGTTGSLFSVPPANIKSNFTSSGTKPVLGLFTAKDLSVSNKVVVTQALEDQLVKQ
jgi:hypothetical protein